MGFVFTFLSTCPTETAIACVIQGRNYWGAGGVFSTFLKDCVHIWVKFHIYNAILRVSRKETFLWSLSVMYCRWYVYLSAFISKDLPSPLLKTSWLCPWYGETITSGMTLKHVKQREEENGNQWNIRSECKFWLKLWCLNSCNFQKAVSGSR